MGELEIFWKAAVVTDGKCLGGTAKNREGPYGSWCSGRGFERGISRIQIKRVTATPAFPKLMEIIFSL